jgi:hypothetical protein
MFESGLGAGGKKSKVFDLGFGTMQVQGRRRSRAISLP